MSNEVNGDKLQELTTMLTMLVQQNQAAQNGGRIIQDLMAVKAELTAVVKGQVNKEQKYMFRSIDDVLNAVGPLFSAHQIIVAKKIEKEEWLDGRQSKSGTKFEHVRLEVRYIFTARDGSTYSEQIGKGEGRDTQDKAMAKALSACLKNALVELFSIPTKEQYEEGVDLDASAGSQEPDYSFSFKEFEVVLAMKFDDQEKPMTVQWLIDYQRQLPKTAKEREDVTAELNAYAARLKDKNLSLADARKKAQEKEHEKKKAAAAKALEDEKAAQNALAEHAKARAEWNKQRKRLKQEEKDDETLKAWAIETLLEEIEQMKAQPTPRKAAVKKKEEGQ